MSIRADYWDWREHRSSRSTIHGLVQWLAGIYAKMSTTVSGVAPALIQETAMLPWKNEDLTKSEMCFISIESLQHSTDEEQRFLLVGLDILRRLLRRSCGWSRLDMWQTKLLVLTVVSLSSEWKPHQTDEHFGQSDVRLHVATYEKFINSSLYSNSTTIWRQFLPSECHQSVHYRNK